MNQTSEVLKRINRVSIKDIEKELDKMEIDALISRVHSADEHYQSLKIGKQKDQTIHEEEIESVV